jgi:hypothetical protein
MEKSALPQAAGWGSKLTAAIDGTPFVVNTLHYSADEKVVQNFSELGPETTVKEFVTQIMLWETETQGRAERPALLLSDGAARTKLSDECTLLALSEAGSIVSLRPTCTVTDCEGSLDISGKRTDGQLTMNCDQNESHKFIMCTTCSKATDDAKYIGRTTFTKMNGFGKHSSSAAHQKRGGPAPGIRGVHVSPKTDNPQGKPPPRPTLLALPPQASAPDDGGSPPKKKTCSSANGQATPRVEGPSPSCPRSPPPRNGSPRALW